MNVPYLEGKRIHFAGAGGVSVSALAEYALRSGAEVSCSDKRGSAVLRRLAALGARVCEDDDADIIEGCDLVVRSSAVPPDHPALVRAAALGIPALERHEFLARVAEEFDLAAAVAGTHGKTTVTSMIAHILRREGVPFVAHIGGRPVGMGGLVVNGGDMPRSLFLTEACEYGRHLTSLRPSLAVVTGMECDHPDCYRDISEVHAVFSEFLKDCPLAVLPEECAFICSHEHIDICAPGHAGAGESGGRGAVSGAEGRICAYTLTRTLGCGSVHSGVLSRCGRECALSLPQPGAHMLTDAALAVAAACELGAGFESACRALADFKGVERRLERAGSVEGAEVIFDYAHHPTEIACTLDAVGPEGGILAVFQPHTYSRTAAYMDAFAEVLGRLGRVILMPVYAAREQPGSGADSRDLARRITEKNPHCGVYYAENADEAYDLVKLFAPEYDVVLMLGAGDIYDMKERFAPLTRCPEG